MVIKLEIFQFNVMSAVKFIIYFFIGQIFDAMYQSRFLVCNAKMVRLSRAEAEEFYAEHVGKPFFE